ncbi:MAG: hypothetical protein AVDCRST_MAG59-2277, partial [uncultured Thermomicrobiales bacterium]
GLELRRDPSPPDSSPSPPARRERPLRGFSTHPAFGGERRRVRRTGDRSPAFWRAPNRRSGGTCFAKEPGTPRAPAVRSIARPASGMARAALLGRSPLRRSPEDGV